jgi:hypothetical protein
MEPCPVCGMHSPSKKHIYTELRYQIKDRIELMLILADLRAAIKKAEGGK